jgi:hypothetical protein
VRFTVEQIFSWTNTAALPLLPTDESADVFVQLRQAPDLGIDEKGRWRARPYTELHGTKDKPHMDLSTKVPDTHWPVFKGASFDLWEPDTEEYYAWANPEEMTEHLFNKRQRSSKYSRSVYSEFSDEWIRNPDTLPPLYARLAFRDISRATDTRTMRIALIPPNVFVTNSAPVILWPRGDELDQAYLLGVLSTRVLDWYTRRFVELHMNYHIFNALPIPRPERDNILWQRIVELTGRLATPDARFADWAAAVGVEHGSLTPPEKDAMIAELDAVVAHLYGLREDQLAHIFETFHVGWDYEQELAVTLDYFREWADVLGEHE